MKNLELSLFQCSLQIAGQWKSHVPKRSELLEQVLAQRGQMEVFSIERVLNDRNVHAASLAHEAIRKHTELSLKTSNQQASSSGEMKNTDECPICFEKPLEIDMLELKGCAHRFCVSCLAQHVEIRVKSNQVPVNCPGDCLSTVGIDECRGVLSPELVEAYGKGLAEASIPESERVYCPFPNCSSFMTKLTPSAEPSTSRAPVIGPTECMECHRLFCAECLVPWHSDMNCEDYQSLPPDGRDAEDIKLHRLARNKNWQQCEKCLRMIELVQGCNHITCRCGHQFCYICGEPWLNNHATSKCNFWDEQHIVK